MAAVDPKETFDPADGMDRQASCGETAPEFYDRTSGFFRHSVATHQAF